MEDSPNPACSRRGSALPQPPPQRKCAPEPPASAPRERGWEERARGPRGPTGRRVPRGRRGRCQGPVPVQVPGRAGGGTEGDASGKQAPRSPARSYLKAREAAGTCAAARLRGAGAQLAPLEARAEVGGGPERDRAARPPELAARLAGKGGARRVSAPVLAARCHPARPRGSCRRACALGLGPEPLFSQCFVKSSTKLENGHQR